VTNKKPANPLMANWDIRGTDIMPSDDEAGMTEEEKVWHRLQHGAPTETFQDFMARELAIGIREELDKELIEQLKGLANEKHK